MGLELHCETCEASTSYRFLDNFRFESMFCKYFPCVSVLLGFPLLLSARHFSSVQSDHKVVAKVRDKFISGWRCYKRNCIYWNVSSNDKSFGRNVAEIELNLSPTLFKNSSLRLKCKLYMFMLCYVAPFCRSFLCNRTSSFRYYRRPVLWSFHLDHKDNVTDFINVSAPFEPDLFLGKSMSFVQHFHHHCGTGQCSSNQPALRNNDASGVPPLWKSCSDIDEERLPKVDVRKQEHTLSDCLVSYIQNYNWEHYVFACTDTYISCFLYS